MRIDARTAMLEWSAAPPTLASCVLDTFFRLGWFGPHKRLWPHNTIHFGEVHYVLKATPQRFSPGLVSAATSDKTAELCNPAHSLVKRRGLLRRCRTMMDGTIQRLPGGVANVDSDGNHALQITAIGVVIATVATRPEP